MRIKETNQYGHSRAYKDWKYYACQKLDGNSCEGGAVEMAALTAQNNSAAIGRLLEVLTAENRLSVKDAMYVLTGRKDLDLEVE